MFEKINNEKFDFFDVIILIGIFGICWQLWKNNCHGKIIVV